jgi:hypothetical protein
MNKEKIQEYVETTLFIVGVVIFGFVIYVAVQFGGAIIETIF